MGANGKPVRAGAGGAARVVSDQVHLLPSRCSVRLNPLLRGGAVKAVFSRSIKRGRGTDSGWTRWLKIYLIKCDQAPFERVDHGLGAVGKM